MSEATPSRIWVPSASLSARRERNWYQRMRPAVSRTRAMYSISGPSLSTWRMRSSQAGRSSATIRSSIKAALFWTSPAVTPNSHSTLGLI